MPRKQLCVLIVLTLAVSGAVASTPITPQDNVRRRPEAQADVALGSLRLDFASQMRLSYDDNANLAPDEDDEESSWRAELGLDTNYYWPVSPAFTLQGNAFLGYDVTLSGEEAEGLIIRSNDGTVFRADARIGSNGFLTITDALSIRLDTYDPGEGEIDEFRIFNNVAAVQYTHRLRPLLKLTGRVDRRDVIAFDDDFDNRDRAVHGLSSRLDWQVRDSTWIWPYVQGSVVDYDTSANNDGHSYEFGLGFTQQFGNRANWNVSVGFEEFIFEDDENPAATDEGSGVTATTSLSYQQTPLIGHGLSLTFERELATATGVNHSEDITGTYTVNWDASERLGVTFSSSVAHSDEQGATGTWDTVWENDLSLRYALGQATLFGGVAHIDRFASIDRAEYDRNRLHLGLRYDF